MAHGAAAVVPPRDTVHRLPPMAPKRRFRAGSWPNGNIAFFRTPGKAPAAGLESCRLGRTSCALRPTNRRPGRWSSSPCRTGRAFIAFHQEPRARSCSTIPLRIFRTADSAARTPVQPILCPLGFIACSRWRGCGSRKRPVRPKAAAGCFYERHAPLLFRDGFRAWATFQDARPMYWPSFRYLGSKHGTLPTSRLIADR